MIAADRGQVERDQPVGRRSGFQRARQDVAQVHDPVDAAAGDVGQHGVERREIAMDVGQGCDPHRQMPSRRPAVNEARISSAPGGRRHRPFIQAGQGWLQ